MRLTGPADEVTAVFEPEAPSLAVERAGTTVVRPSVLAVETLFDDLHGVEWADGGDVTVSERERVEERYEMKRGKARERSHRATAATATYVHPDADGVVEVDLRAATDGVAFRYRVTGEGRDLTNGDETTLSMPERAVSWLIPFEKAHEASARQQPIGQAGGEYCPPGLFEVDGEWALVCEAGADGSYATARLRVDETDVTFAVPNTKLNAHFPLETPWRVVAVGDLATVVESTLVTDLAGPAAVDDDWVEPGRVTWSWWSESDSPSDLDRQRDYLVYAAERGWEYVLVDDGWQAERESIPAFVDEAAELGVGVFLWAHWTDLNTETKRAERLSTWREWGVDGIKVDFMDHDDQGRTQFYDHLAEAAADHELLVNFHGSVVPTGLQRRYPHVMTYEGVMGAEYYKWSTLSPEHNCALPFTRNVVGPMDYTPVTFSADSRHTTAGHELALSVVFESALQHFADGVDAYGARPLAESFLEAVPAAWDETRFVGGHPGVEATLARRAGATAEAAGEWFLGSITAGPERVVSADLSFLEGEWTAHVVRDDGADGLEREERTVTGGDALDVSVDANGGFVARFTR